MKDALTINITPMKNQINVEISGLIKPFPNCMSAIAIPVMLAIAMANNQGKRLWTLRLDGFNKFFAEEVFAEVLDDS